MFRVQNVDMLTDGWKWNSRGSSKLPRSQPVYRRTLYFYHSQDGMESNFQRHVYRRLDDEYVPSQLLPTLSLLQYLLFIVCSLTAMDIF